MAGQLASALRLQGEGTSIRASLLGENSRRAAVAKGRASFFEKALLTNDTDLAKERLTRFEVEEGMTVGPSVRRIMLRYALRVLAEVAREDARRERGEYSKPELDPLMALPIWDGHPSRAHDVAPDLTIAAAPAMLTAENGQGTDVGTTPADLVRVAAVARFMETSAAAIAQIEARPVAAVGAKQIRDYDVAGRLFCELCGDLEISGITRETCQYFVAELSRVPSQHGKGERYRNMTAREAILAADGDDAASMRDAVATGSDPEDAPRVACIALRG